MSAITQAVSARRGDAMNSAADENMSTVKPSDLMSLHMDSRKNRSSSTTETSTFFIMPPWPFAGPAVRANCADAPHGMLYLCENATSAMPMPRKLWLISTTIVMLSRHDFRRGF
jgi:hypothetical protein